MYVCVYTYIYMYSHTHTKKSHRALWSVQKSDMGLGSIALSTTPDSKSSTTCELQEIMV